MVARVSVCFFDESCFVAPEVAEVRDRTGRLTVSKVNRINNRTRAYIQIKGGSYVQQALLMPWGFIVDLVVEQKSGSGRRGSTHTLDAGAAGQPYAGRRCHPKPEPPRSSYAHRPMTQKFHREQSQARHSPSTRATLLFRFAC